MLHVNPDRLVNYPQLKRAFRSQRMPTFAQDPRLADVDVVVEFDFPMNEDDNKINLGNYSFVPLPNEQFFIHPYENDNELKRMIDDLQTHLKKAVNLEEQLFRRLHLPGNQHSFIVQVEMLYDSRSLDRENLCVSHRRLVSHTIFVHVLHDRIKALQGYIALLENFWTKINARFLTDIEQLVKVYGRWLKRYFGDQAVMIFFEFWHECSPLDKIAAASLSVLDRSERAANRSLADLFHYIQEYNYCFNHFTSFDFMYRR